MIKYEYPPYEKQFLAPEDLQLSRSKKLLSAIHSHDFCNFIECGIFENGNEFIVFDTEVEIGQFKKNDIYDIERILIEIFKNDVNLPYVYAVREDFPKDLLHFNILNFESPKCLCLYDQPSNELKLSWTGFTFIERTREWLNQAAIGDLHDKNQPLEHFIIGSFGKIILPHPIDLTKSLKVSRFDSGLKPYFYSFKASYEPNDSKNAEENDFHLLILKSKEIVHRAFPKVPVSLKDLIEILENIGIDLIQQIDALSLDDSNKDKKLLILLCIPTKRKENDNIEIIHKYSFLIDLSIQKIAIEVGILIKNPSDNGYLSLIQSLLEGEEKEKTLDEIRFKSIEVPVYLLTPIDEYSKTLARQISYAKENDSIICQIGGGAIGSPIFKNLTCAGFGKNYIIIDDDVYLPHNASRHSLSYLYQGYFKSKALSIEANMTLNDPEYSEGIVANINGVNCSESELKIIENADIVIDTSASQPTARFLSRLDKLKGKIVSVFINQSGKDLVILAEGKDRKILVTNLEMNYFKELIRNGELADHLDSQSQQVRYATSCRDLSWQMPNEYLTIHGGIASRFIRNFVDTNESHAYIYRINDDDSIKKFNIPVSSYITIEKDDWKIHINNETLEELKNYRINKLPDETGGILIGSFDMNSHDIYIVDSIYSPEDSIEYPTAYIRGIKGVNGRLKEIEKRTLYNLEYIGEWHSHPLNASVRQSSDDILLFNWLTNFMNNRGLPGLMLILGDDEIGLYCK